MNTTSNPPVTVERFVVLCRSFPSIAARLTQTHSGGLPTVLMEIASGARGGAGAVGAARFLMHVWNGQPFDMRQAWSVWDDKHRRAFKNWAADPWFV